jgi:hypothetical protein
MTAAEILHRLRARYSEPEWLCWAELRIATGSKRGERRIDFFALNTYPSKSHERIACEIKTSRADLRRELRTPEKRKPALLLANRYYIVAPVGVIPVESLPIDAGLIECHESGLTKIKSEAPWLDTEPPTWGFVAALIRHTRHELMKTISLDTRD